MICRISFPEQWKVLYLSGLIIDKWNRSPRLTAMSKKTTRREMSSSLWSTITIPIAIRTNKLGRIEMIKAEKIFDMSAKTYDKTEEKRFEPIHIKTLKNTKKYLNVSDIVLDYGCATGTKALEIAGHVKKIQGLDISSKMIEAAKRKAIERKIENVDFVQATIFDERYTRASFDVILAFNILHLLDDNEHIMQRMHELLKPGGLCISVTTCLGEKKSLLINFQFFPFRLLIKTGLFPNVKRFKFSELEDVIANGNLQIVETEKLFHEMSFYFIVAKKIERT
jgi:2-polyprenyl-3-methyl-5-hydroxy-6-metoxy-1,4-benzoquinol methylase